MEGRTEPPSDPRPGPTSLGSLLAGAAAAPLGLASGKEKSCSIWEKSGSTRSASGLLSRAHMELCSVDSTRVRPVPARDPRAGRPRGGSPPAAVTLMHAHACVQAASDLAASYLGFPGIGTTAPGQQAPGPYVVVGAPAWVLVAQGASLTVHTHLPLYQSGPSPLPPEGSYEWVRHVRESGVLTSGHVGWQLLPVQLLHTQCGWVYPPVDWDPGGPQAMVHLGHDDLFHGTHCRGAGAWQGWGWREAPCAGERWRWRG